MQPCDLCSVLNSGASDIRSSPVEVSGAASGETDRSLTVDVNLLKRKLNKDDIKILQSDVIIEEQLDSISISIPHRDPVIP